MKIIKTIIKIILIIAAIFGLGLLGNMDHDEYIEVNSKPVPQFIRRAK